MAINSGCGIHSNRKFELVLPDGRTGELNQLDEVALLESFSNFYASRGSHGKVINKRSRLLVEYFEDRAFFLLNGISRSDTPASFTYCGSRGNSTVDLVFMNFVNSESVLDLRVNPIVTLSDHLPITVLMYDVVRIKVGYCQVVGGDVYSGDFKWPEERGVGYTETMCWLPEVRWCDVSSEMGNENIIQAISTVAESLGLQKLANKSISGKPWFNKDCFDLKRKVKEL